MARTKTDSRSLSRREFLRGTMTVALSGGSVLKTPRGQDASQSKPWYSVMRRCGQINFNERDPLTMDADDWMNYWASLKVDAVLLNGGGIVAFYPTRVPFHHRSQFLGSRDLFGDMVAAAKKRGLRVVARMDCNFAYAEAWRAHPEWFERNADGSPRTHDECTWLYKTCMFSSYFTEQMPAIYREIASVYPVDGFFTNGWPSTSALEVCACQTCQRIFRDNVGGVPPEHTDASNPLYRKYYEVTMDRVLEVWRLWDAVAKEKNPNSIYVGNLGGGIHTVKSVKKLAEVAGWFNADHQGRSDDTPIWHCAQQGRVAQSVMNGRTITNVTGAYSNSSIVWRHTAKSPTETALWLAQTTASGMVPWFHWLGGSPEDNRWRETGRAFYQWLAANEPHFRNTRSLADLAVLYPQSTIAFYQHGKGVQPTDYLQGLYYALLEGRFVFDFVHQENLSETSLRRYRALLVPNAAYLRDSECEAIRGYVREGGSLLATFETSRYNEWGDPRPDFALADVFGANVAGETIGPFGNSYLRIARPHDVIRGFEGTTLLPCPEYRVPVRATNDEPLLLSIVPHYPAYPPEMVYPRTPKTNEPGVLVREQGKSRVAYFPGDIERSLWRSGNTDLSRLLQNAILWVQGRARAQVSVRGEGVVELFAWETKPGYTLHLLNYTNPNMTRGFVRRFYPIGPQQVEFAVPTGKRITSVRALRASRSLDFKQEGDTVQLEVPAVLDYEVVALT
jgi:putative glycosyl hydrolase-like family 6 (GHL6) protein